MPKPLGDGRFRYRGLRTMASDARSAYVTRRPESRDHLLIERAKRRKSPNLRQPPATVDWALARPWLWLEIGGAAGTWFRSLEDALANIRPEQLRAETLPELVWTLRGESAKVHIGEFRFLRHGMDPLICRFGCLADRAQDLEHELTPRAELQKLG